MLFSPSLLLFSLLYNQTCEKNACKHLYDYPSKCLCLSTNCYNSGNVGTTTLQMITSNNYKYETHVVTTEDGYNLTLFRIPPETGAKRPIFLMHGIGMDSSVWVNTGNRSLAFNLADRGYDVWLGNTRGTIYSSAGDSYTLDDLGKDLNASMLHIAQSSGPVLYLGHSRGSTIMSMFASEFPEYASGLVEALVFLSPVVYFDNVSKPELEYATLIVLLFKIFGQPAVFYPSRAIHGFAVAFCTMFPYVCRELLNFRFGTSEQFLPEDLLNVYGRYPQIISFGNLLQYSQIYRSGKLQKYDYGVTKNVELYGQETPPLYNLSNIRIPTVLYWGKNDKFTSTESMTRLYDELGSTVKMLKTAPVGKMNGKYDFNHLDFLFAGYIKEFLYDDLFSTLDKLSKTK